MLIPVFLCNQELLAPCLESRSQMRISVPRKEIAGGADALKREIFSFYIFFIKNNDIYLNR